MPSLIAVYSKMPVMQPAKKRRLLTQKTLNFGTPASQPPGLAAQAAKDSSKTPLVPPPRPPGRLPEKKLFTL